MGDTATRFSCEVGMIPDLLFSVPYKLTRNLLVRFARATLRWTDDQIDSTLHPLRASLLSSDSTQTTLPSYFLKYSDGRRGASVRSKRLRAAFGSLSSKSSAHGDAPESGADLARTVIGPRTKRKRKTSQPQARDRDARERRKYLQTNSGARRQCAIQTIDD